MNKQELKQRGLRRLWRIQLSITLVVTIFCALAYDVNAAKSALLGGLVCIIPGVLFAVKLFQYQGARAARQIVSNFYKGEALKLIVSAMLFAAVFALCRITPAAFFASYILVLMTHWFAPWIIVIKQNRPESD